VPSQTPPVETAVELPAAHRPCFAGVGFGVWCRHANLIRARIPWWSVLGVLPGLAVIGLASGVAVHEFADYRSLTAKRVQEPLSVVVLGCAVLVAACSLIAMRGRGRGRGVSAEVPWRRWWLVLAALLMLREIHPPGLGSPLQAMIAAWLAWGYWDAERSLPAPAHRVATGWLFAGLCGYGVAYALDHGLFKFFVHYELWRANAEETIEGLGHACVLAGTVMGRASGDELCAGRQAA